MDFVCPTCENTFGIDSRCGVCNESLIPQRIFAETNTIDGENRAMFRDYVNYLGARLVWHRDQLTKLKASPWYRRLFTGYERRSHEDKTIILERAIMHATAIVQARRHV